MQAKNPERKVNVSLKAIRMYLILGLVYLFLFGLMGSLNQLVGNPGLFANLVSAFALFSMSQGFLVFYNVFYESKDLQSYRPYAFSEAEIIVGKSISVILTLLIAILPMFSYFLVLAFQGGNPFLGPALGSACYFHFKFSHHLSDSDCRPLYYQDSLFQKVQDHPVQCHSGSCLCRILFPLFYD